MIDLLKFFFIEPGWGLGLFLKQLFKIPPCIIFWAKIKYKDRQTEDHTCENKTKTKLWQTQKLKKLGTGANNQNGNLRWHLP